MSFTFAGISSGLDTNALIDGLMFAERTTVRRLEASQAQETASLNAWTDIETKLNAISTAVAAIATSGALEAATAASEDETVVRATSTGSPVLGTYALRVTTLAAAQQETSVALASGSDLVGAGTVTVSGNFASFDSQVASNTLNAGTYTLTVLSIDTGASTVTVNFDGVNQTVALGAGDTFTVAAADGGTLSASGAGGSGLTTGTASLTVITADGTTTVNNVLSALNVPGGPVRAQLVDTGDGSSTPYRLIVTASQTGLDAAFSEDFSNLSLFSAGLSSLRSADNAVLQLGGASGITITRPSNTIGDLIEGLSIDLVGTSNQNVDIVVAADAASRVNAVTAVVDAVTAVISQLARYSSYDVERESGGALTGDFTARSIQREVSDAMSTLVSSSSFVILGQIGITIETDGTYGIDEAVLLSALTADPAGVEQVLLGDPTVTNDGVFDVVKQTVDSLTATGGRIPTAKDAADASITALDILIELQEVRLLSVEDRIRRQFTALEQLIGQLNSQSGFLESVLSNREKS